MQLLQLSYLFRVHAHYLFLLQNLGQKVESQGKLEGNRKVANLPQKHGI